MLGILLVAVDSFLRFADLGECLVVDIGQKKEWCELSGGLGVGMMSVGYSISTGHPYSKIHKLIKATR